jgi:hypothetical protein
MWPSAPSKRFDDARNGRRCDRVGIVAKIQDHIVKVFTPRIRKAAGRCAEQRGDLRQFLMMPKYDDRLATIDGIRENFSDEFLEVRNGAYSWRNLYDA